MTRDMYRRVEAEKESEWRAAINAQRVRRKKRKKKSMINHNKKGTVTGGWGF